MKVVTMNITDHKPAQHEKQIDGKIAVRNGPDIVDVIEMKFPVVINYDDHGGDASHAGQRSNIGFHVDNHPGGFRSQRVHVSS